SLVLNMRMRVWVGMAMLPRICGYGSGALALTGVAVGLVAALGGDVAGDVLGVVPYPPDEGGAAARQPGQTEEVHSRLARHAALMQGLALGVEGVDLQPGEVHGIAGGPDNRSDAGIGQVQLADRAAHALGIRITAARLGLLRQIQAV